MVSAAVVKHYNCLTYQVKALTNGGSRLGICVLFFDIVIVVAIVAIVVTI